MEKKKKKKRQKKTSKNKKKVIQKKRKKAVKKQEPTLSYAFFLWAIFLLIFTFLSFLSFLFFQNYKTWEQEFLSSDIEFLDYQNETVDLDEKIRWYNEQKSEYAFIEFSKQEALFLFSQGLDGSLPDWFEVEKTALGTSSGEWSFFVKTSIWNFKLPWFEILLLKDQYQSIEIYIEDIFVGNFSFRNSFLNSTLEKANNGLANAIRSVNDGNFAGRLFENIELGEEKLVVKSRNIIL